MLDDATAQEAALAELREAAETDDLTGLLTRRGLRRHVDALGPHDYPLVVAVADVDCLRRTNDVYGHAAGDVLLRAVATRITRAAGAGAVVARLSGDEFLVLVPARRWPHRTLVEAVRDAVSASPVDLTGGATVAPAVSVGLARLGRLGSFAAALTAADAAMSADKRTGCPSVVGV